GETSAAPNHWPLRNCADRAPWRAAKAGCSAEIAREKPPCRRQCTPSSAPRRWARGEEASIPRGNAKANHFPSVVYTAGGAAEPRGSIHLDLNRGTSIALAASALLAASACGGGDRKST